MNFNIAFDFDGVCTDLSFLNEAKVNEFAYLFSPFSISISKKRNGIYELMSVFGLFGDIFIITSRPSEDGIYIKNWLSENKLLPLVKDIICCGDIAKSKLMKQCNIELLIDDKLTHLNDLNDSQKGILWKEQNWVEIVLEVFDYFILRYGSLEFDHISKSALCKVDCLSDLGSSPVFILNFCNKSKLKIRVCIDEKLKNRMLNFLRVTESNEYHHVARFIASNGLAILKTFINGQSISTFNKSDRIAYILKAGVALAKLHSIELNSSISDLKFSLKNCNECLLVFSADNYNMVITGEDEVAFIDLEACNNGSRWIDFFWAERLLCNNQSEKNALREGYFSLYSGDYPCDEERKLAQLNCSLWIDYHLRQSKLIHSSKPTKIQVINDTLIGIWEN